VLTDKAASVTYSGSRCSGLHVSLPRANLACTKYLYCWCPMCRDCQASVDSVWVLGLVYASNLAQSSNAAHLMPGPTPLIKAPFHCLSCFLEYIPCFANCPDHSSWSLNWSHPVTGCQTRTQCMCTTCNTLASCRTGPGAQNSITIVTATSHIRFTQRS